MDPESRFPAQKEDVDTIITGKDGKDYIVDIIDGIKKWVLYLPEPNDHIIVEKVLPDIEIQQSPPETEKKGNPNKYQTFLSEMTKKLKKEEPHLNADERRKKISELWKIHKSSC